MPAAITIAVTGDSIINRRISVNTDERFLSVVKILRDADVAYTHLESLIHDYDGPEVYPAAEAGWTWMRSPRFIPDELKWAGFDIVSHASNHCVDYSYGGLFSTWKALDEAGLPHAGTGRNLGEAREPAYLDTAKGRVALVSMCSTFTGWARAGEARRDVKGRPGLNPLRYYYVADARKLEMVKQLAFDEGWCISNQGKTWYFCPPGLMMAIRKYVEGDKPGMHTAVDEDDAEGNLRSIRDAARQADYVLVHLHNHEFHPEKGLNTPPDFVPPFARACIDAGAHIFVGEGSHAPTRGIEVYKNRPIFYDPGDFFGMSLTVTKMPADYYLRPGYPPEIRDWRATPADVYDARVSLPKLINPPGGMFSARVKGSVVGLCSLGQDGKLSGLRLHPVTMDHGNRSRGGIPLLAGPDTAGALLEYLGDLSAPFGTRIDFDGASGVVKLPG
ncbi:MAG: CapA family protein [Chloroflexi bacterium]|nr:CapA family protein [Chloroflexota bacterium]